MNDLKIIVASNLIRLRTVAGMTQADLGAKLNYSDKSVSKWERAESLPDAAVLKQLAEIFGVTVDYLLNSHDEWKPDGEDEQEHPIDSYSPTMIILVSILGVWTLAILLFVIFWILGHKEWFIFVAAIPSSLAILLTLNTLWNGGRYNLPIVAALVLSVIFLVYFSLLKFNPWQLFFVAIPAELIVVLSFRIKKHASSGKTRTRT